MPWSFDQGTIAGRATIAGAESLFRAKAGANERPSARGRCRRMEHQRVAVHAMAPARRLRSIVENGAEVAAAAAAMHLVPQHAESAVGGGAPRVFQRLVEGSQAQLAFAIRGRAQ